MVLRSENFFFTIMNTQQIGTQNMRDHPHQPDHSHFRTCPGMHFTISWYFEDFTMILGGV